MSTHLNAKTAPSTMEKLWKEIAREILPPAIRRLGNKFFQRGIVYSGPYVDWAAAERVTDGYSQASILSSVSSATQSVLAGDGVFEQDGVLFQTAPPPPSPALLGILLAASIDGGELTVLDFGGALGSLFLRWRPWLEHLPDLRWHVVEQAHFVAAGKALFTATRHPLLFCNSLNDLKHNPNVVIASGVLHYLPAPYKTLSELAAIKPRIIVVDRTPFARRGDGHILVQRVTKPLLPASYPLVTLSRKRLAATLSDQYTLLQHFPSPDTAIQVQGAEADYGGEIWIRKG